MVWDYFDDIVCINLKHRTDRYEKSKKIFEELNIPVRYYHPEKHPTSGEQGCFESHIKLIRDAYNSGKKNILIFEDDIVKSSHYSNRALNQSVRFMKTHDWDLFYFGALSYLLRYKPVRVFGNVYKTHSLCTHAYAVNRKIMKKIMNMPYMGITIDYIYANMKNAYAYHPTLFYQDDSLSDINNVFWNGGNMNVKTFGMRAIEILNVELGMTSNNAIAALIVAFILLILLLILIMRSWLVIPIIFLIIAIMLCIIFIF